MKDNRAAKRIYLIMSIVISCGVVCAGIFSVWDKVDSRYAKAEEFCSLKQSFDKKVLRDDIFDLKVLVIQEKQGAGNPQTIAWMEERIQTKQDELSTILGGGR